MWDIVCTYRRVKKTQSHKNQSIKSTSSVFLKQHLTFYHNLNISILISDMEDPVSPEVPHTAPSLPEKILSLPITLAEYCTLYKLAWAPSKLI